MNYKLNIKKSNADERDYQAHHYIALGAKAPSTLDYRKDLLPARDQGKDGACAAFSSACMKEWQEKKESGVLTYMSPQFIYNNRSNKDSDGMTTRDLMKILQTKGCCLESQYPYETKTPITVNTYKAALYFTIKSYAFVSTVDDLKKSLYNNGPCLIAIPVYNYSNRMWRKTIGDDLLGGHAMCVVGYDKTGFIIRNSWGPNWNDKGYTIFPYEDWGMQWEAWTMVDNTTPKTPAPTPQSKIKTAVNKIKSKFGF